MGPHCKFQCGFYNEFYSGKSERDLSVKVEENMRSKCSEVF